MSACYIVIPGSWVLYGYYIGPGSQELAGAAFGPWPCHGGMWHTKKKNRIDYATVWRIERVASTRRCTRQARHGPKDSPESRKL